MNIHRSSLQGTVCGKSGKVSNTGVYVTCPDCIRPSQPITREEAMRQIMEAAKRRTASK